MAALNLKYPRILGVGINGVAAATQLIKFDADDTHTGLHIAPGSWTVSGTYGQQAMASAAAAADYVIEAIYDAYLNKLDKQWYSGTDLNENDMYCEAFPIGKIIFDITEDALTTPIADSGTAGGAFVIGTTAVYADLTVTAPTDPGIANSYGIGIPTILLDSNTINTSSSGLLVQVLGHTNDAQNAIYSATAAASPRTFRIKVIDACATFSQ